MTLGIYLRLSFQDRTSKVGGQIDESNSIANQRALIQEYIRSHSELKKWEIKEYCDDGFTGTNMERPGIQDLLSDVRKSKIDGIIVKDFSRFSRDYIEMGAYLETVFPFMGVRFFSINNQYDSKSHVGSALELDMAFQTLLYDFYSKDLSVKVKTAKRIKCENGEYVSGRTPLGYEKVPGSKNLIRINEEEAEIVRHIFELSAQGISPLQISHRLYKEGVPTFTQMRNMKRREGRLPCWEVASVRTILKNRFYLGEFVYNKSVLTSPTSRKRIRLPENEWKTLTNHHEPIISLELFEKAVIPKASHSNKRKHPKHPLTGKLSCGGCGHTMVLIRKLNGRFWPVFACRKHAQLKIETCCNYFKVETLEQVVLYLLNQELLKVLDFEKSRGAFEGTIRLRMAELKAQEKEMNRQLKELEEGTAELYEKYVMREMTALEYRNEVDRLDKSARNIKEDIAGRRSDIKEMQDVLFQNRDDLKDVLRYSHVDELTQEVVDFFIKKVKVSKNKIVEIEWNFQVPNLNGSEVERYAI